MVLRAERTGIDLKFYELCQRVVKDNDLDLYDMDYLPGSYELRLFVIDPNTNSAVIDDCIKIDKALTPHIEEQEWMPSELTLEVSSPGMFRSLKTIEHFKKVEGENILLNLRQKLDDPELPRKLRSDKKVKVKLLAVGDESISVLAGEKELEVLFDNIKKANLEPDF